MGLEKAAGAISSWRTGEEGVPIRRRSLPERHGDWRPLTVFQKWPWMNPAGGKLKPSSEGPFGYLGHLRSGSCLCHSLRSPQGKGVGVSREEGQQLGVFPG